MDNYPDKWYCRHCRAVGKLAEGWDFIPDPRPSAAAGDGWHVCRHCDEIDQITTACDEPGCTAEGACGFPTDTGYRRTCYEHSVFKRERDARESGASTHVDQD